jgi:hypothetical protein
VAEASRRAEQFAATWRPRYPAAAGCLLDDFELLTAHLHHPRAHWPRIRHTNLIEHTFGETRRRVKVIGRLPGERSALPLVWAVLDRAVAGWRGITYTPADTRQLQTIRRQLGVSRPQPKRNPPHPTPSLSHQPHSMLVKSCAQCRFYTSAGRLPSELGPLAQRYSVSSEAMLLRLIGVGKASWGTYRLRKPELEAEYAAAKERDRSKRRQQEGGPSYYTVKVRDLGRSYVRSVLDAFYSRQISSLDATDFLDAKFNHLERLEEVAGR